MTGTVKMFVPHSSDCYLAEQGREEFIVPALAHPTVYRAMDGTFRGNSTMWYVFRCNAINCHGEAMVRYDAVMDLIAEGLV